MSIFNKGAFVQYNWRYYVLLDFIMPVVESETYLPIGYILEDLVTKAVIETDLEVQLILEHWCYPFEGIRVVYNDTVWTVENVEIPDSLSGPMYHIRRNNASIAVDRDDFRIFNPVHDKGLLEIEEPYISIKVGDFVTCPYTTHVCVVLDIEKDGLTKIESIVDQHTYGCSVRDLYLLQEQDIDPDSGVKVIYKNTIWIVYENVWGGVYEDGNWKVYNLKNNFANVNSVLREEFRIWNPVLHIHEIDWNVVEENKFYPVITTGSFVNSPNTFNVSVVMDIDGIVCRIQDLVKEFEYTVDLGELEHVAEQDIKLVPGMKIIYDGKVGTYYDTFPDFDTKEPLHRVPEEGGVIIKAHEYEIFNPYFHDYEEKNGVKVLKLRDFIDTPLKPFNEGFYFMGVDPFQNEEPLGCSTSFSVGELKKGIEYRDFVKMAENDAESYHKGDLTEKDDFEKEMTAFENSITQGLKQSKGKLMVQELYWPFIEQMARVMTINKEKYPPKNYMKPIDKEELLAAAQRHQLSIWLGEEIDPTDGQPNAVKVATNMMMYFCQCKLYPDA